MTGADGPRRHIPKRRLTVAAAVKIESGQDLSELFKGLADKASQQEAAPLVRPKPPTPAPAADVVLPPVLEPPTSPSPPSLEQTLQKAAPLKNLGEGLPVKASGAGEASGGFPGDGALEAARGAATGAVDAASGAVDAAKEALAASAASSLDALSGVTSGISSTAGEAVSALTSTAESLAAGLGEATAGVTSSLQAVQSSFAAEADVVRRQAEGVAASVAAVQAQASAAVESVYGSLPAPVQDAIAALGPPLSAFAQQVSEDPAIAAAAAGGLVGLPALLYWQARFSGYSGLLSPEGALAILQTEDAVLVDIRTEEGRQAGGVPELRFGARGKAAAVPVPQITAALARKIRSSDQLSFEIAAAVISGLSKVTSKSKIVVMDSGDGKALKTARLVRSAGRQKVFVLEGGYKAWKANGLPVTEGGPADYESTPLDGLADSAELLREQTAIKLKDPLFVVGALGGSGLAVTAALNIAYTLEFIGVLGILLTIINKVSTYNSIDDAVADFNAAVDAVQKPVKAVRGLLPKVQAPKRAASLPAALREEPLVPGEGKEPPANGASTKSSVQKAEA
eukprot:jgi/Botrbrau1/21994/Bobra.0024s0010.2